MLHTVKTQPEFCPNSCCRFHDRGVAATHQWYVRFGRFPTRARGLIQRFRCTECGKTCSTQTFSVHYWTHYTNDLAWLLGQLSTCAGLRQIGRVAGVTHRVITNRCRRLARNALAVMDLALHTIDTTEHLAMDGFESFTASKYHPNNVTHLTGCSSQFVYAAVHTLLRRKGAMTEKQKRLRAYIDAVWRPSTNTGEQTAFMLSDLAPLIARASHRRGKPLELHTDEHQAYPRAIRSVPTLRALLAAGTLHHCRTNSHVARTHRNPLFAVNYVDRQLRTCLAEYVRRTIRYGREVNAQMERFSIFMVIHNFLTPHRITGHAQVLEQTTHADVAGVRDKGVIALLKRMTTHRHVYTHLKGAHWWIRKIWLRLHDNPPVVRTRRGELEWRWVCLGQAAVPRYLLT
jgi:hypothetical protein